LSAETKQSAGEQNNMTIGWALKTERKCKPWIWGHIRKVKINLDFFLSKICNAEILFSPCQY
jgi:hypothetical protein